MSRILAMLMLSFVLSGIGFGQWSSDEYFTKPALPEGVSLITNKKITVQLKNKQLNTWELKNGKWKKTFSCLVAVGVWNNPTPVGEFYIYYKERWATDKKTKEEYGPAMDFAMRYDNVRLAIHGWDWDPRLKVWGWGSTRLGKVSVTGGCIKMLRRDIAAIYDWAPLGTPLIISR